MPPINIFNIIVMLFRFQEIKKKDKVAAMQFLQTSVSELIDHSDTQQIQEVSQIC